MTRNEELVLSFTAVAAAAIAYVVVRMPAEGPLAAAYLGILAPVAVYLSFALKRHWDRLRRGALHSEAVALGGAALPVVAHGALTWMTPGADPRATFVFALAVGGAAALLQAGRHHAGRVWWGLAALAALWLPYELRWIPPLELPRESAINVAALLLLDAGLYLYLVFWRLDRVGFDFGLSGQEVRTALAQFGLLVVPLAGLGFALGFIAWQPQRPSLEMLLLRPLGIYFLNALPEEFLFRGVLHNLLARKLPFPACLIVSSGIFGLGHVNNPWPNWPYVAMATLAGWFYGRAYVKTGKITASALVHTLVNWTWATFFHL